MNRWLKDENRRSYERIEHSCVRKEDQRKSVYYAFPEIRHERLVSSSTDEQKQENVAHFLDYVLFLVGDETAHVEWMVMWLADILVNPHDKGKKPVAVVLCGYGEHGLRDLMEQLLRKRLVLGVSRLTRRTGNAELKYKLFVEFEDVDLRADRRTAARIRATITERTRAITNSTYVTASERVLITTSHACNVESGPMFVTFIAAPRRGAAFPRRHVPLGREVPRPELRKGRRRILALAHAGLPSRDERAPRFLGAYQGWHVKCPGGGSDEPSS